jgi:hypothetical protein
MGSGEDQSRGSDRWVSRFVSSQRLIAPLSVLRVLRIEMRSMSSYRIKIDWDRIDDARHEQMCMHCQMYLRVLAGKKRKRCSQNGSETVDLNEARSSPLCNLHNVHSIHTWIHFFFLTQTYIHTYIRTHMFCPCL